MRIMRSVFREAAKPGSQICHVFIFDIRRPPQTLAPIHRPPRLFRMIFDESTDVSNKEQLTFVLRGVSMEDMSIHEDFLGMYLLERTDPDTLTSVIHDIFLRCKLKIENCRWQSY